LVAKRLKLPDPFVHRRKVLMPERHYARTRRVPGSLQFQDLADLVQRERERLRLCDEAQFLDGPL
jgi:hypothetical protein